MTKREGGSLRSAPALVSGNLGAVWINLLTPVLGVWLAVGGRRAPSVA